MKNKLIDVIIFVLLDTAIIPNYIYATSLDNLEVNTQTFEDIHSSYDMDSFNQMKDSATADINVEAGTKTKTIRETLSLGAGVATAIGGLIMWPVSTVSIFITFITRGSENLLIKGDKVTEWNRSNVARMKVNGYSINWFTIEDTVFGDIDLFNTDYLSTNNSSSDVNIAIKESVAVFYYISKVIAVVMGMLMLIYLGIRMAISTIASEIAKYKEMIKDWLVSMVLIFAMPYLIVFINFAADSLTELFATIESVNGFEKSIIWQSINLLNITSGWSYIATIIMYVVITVYQIKFFLMYINRLLAMGFLIIISPIVTIMYSATKTKIAGKGGKAGALDNWLKEYTVNAFLQPLHAGIYMVFIISANEIFKVAPFLAIIFFAALTRAEKIVKNMFGMRKMSSIHSMSEYMPMKRKKK